MKVLLVVGARPNYMKVAPLMERLEERSRATGTPVKQMLVHTGQHYDDEMSKVFFEDLELPRPDHFLSVGSGPHGGQTGEIMIAFERVCFEEKPDLVVVVGDVNSTLACALVAVKLGIPVAHVEAGLRSFDRRMPEEINRLLTDQIAEWLFAPSPDSVENLRHEGVPAERIFLVGNVMIDSLLRYREKASRSEILSRLGLANGDRPVSQYAVLTLHRPSNVDDEDSFGRLLRAFRQIAAWLPLIFPVHPRTRKQIERLGAGAVLEPIAGPRVSGEARKTGLYAVNPLGYLDFIHLLSHSTLVLTDSGGVQEETTALGVPCLTLRESTERPITVSEGTNTIVGTDPKRVISEAARVLAGGGKRGRIPALWDGRAAERTAAVLVP